MQMMDSWCRTRLRSRFQFSFVSTSSRYCQSESLSRSFDSSNLRTKPSRSRNQASSQMSMHAIRLSWPSSSRTLSHSMIRLGRVLQANSCLLLGMPKSTRSVTSCRMSKPAGLRACSARHHSDLTSGRRASKQVGGKLSLS